MKKIVIPVVTVLLVVCVSFLYIKISRDNEIKNQRREEQKIEEKRREIVSHYNQYVMTTKETNLYEKIEDTYKEVGTVNEKISLELEEMTLDENVQYFKIKDLNYYIKYQDVSPIESRNISDRHRRYVMFNENVVTQEETTFYKDDAYAYHIKSGINLPIYIKDKDKLYVEYNHELLYVKKDEVEVKKASNTTEKTRTNIRTFTYHAVYKEGQTCKNKSICHPYSQFDSHMKYLSENNYLTLTMEELEMFLDKKINIPMKTVVITLDDGNHAANAIEILEKYKLYATYFIITGRYDSYKIKTTYVDFESHSDNLHNNYKCPGGEQGGQLLCETEKNVLADLKLSQDKLGGSKYFSYPFFDWNARAKKLLKEAGFHLAFIGQWTENGYSTFTTDRMMIRRKTIFAEDSLDTFISYLK